MQGDRVTGEGGSQAGKVGAQAAVAAPGQVGAVGVPAERLLLDPALPALEAVPALAQPVQRAACVVPQLQDQAFLSVCRDFTRAASLQQAAFVPCTNHVCSCKFSLGNAFPVLEGVTTATYCNG